MSTVEKVCAFFDARPCNVYHGTAEIGSPEWSEQVTVRKYFVEPHIIEFAEFWKWKGKRVLEIGCGIGTDTLQFVKSGVEHIDAVDISNRSVDLAETRFRKDDPVYFWRCDAEGGLPEGPYDLIYSFGVLHHTPRPESVLRTCRRFLKSDGELRIMLYAKWSWKRLCGHQPEAQAGCPIVRWYSVVGARRLLESCGFRVISIQKTHIFPWRVEDYVEHRYVKAFPWNVIPHRWLEPILGHHLLLKAVRA